MNQTIKKWTSLDNFKKAGISGQMATFLILIITAMLIFVLTLINVGQVSNYATNLANAADSSSLYFASQLGTESYQLSASLYKSCGNGRKCCKSMGFFGIILAIVLAVLSLFLPGSQGVMMFVYAAIAGAIGGGIGGTIDGTGFFQGAIQGAMIGAAIAGGAAVGGSMFGTAAPAAGGGVTPASLANTGFGEFFTDLFPELVGAAGPSATLMAPVVVPSFAGAMAGVGLASGMAVANAFIQMEMVADAMASAAKALNGLPKKQRIRESTFLRAFSDTIDDPNKVADEGDIDGDGDTAEKLPVFQVLWDKRIQDLKAGINPIISQAQKTIDNFFSTEVSNFQSALNTFKASLSRQEIEGSDGSVTELLRGLEVGDGIPPQYPVSFWDPGPDKAALDAWKEAAKACETCEPPPPPAGYDELDSAVEYLQYVSDELNTLKGSATADTWSQWGHFFYDPAPNDAGDAPGEGNWSFYDSLGNLLNGDSSLNPPQIGLSAWNKEIEAIRLRLPACIYDPLDPEGSPTNPPCLGHPTITDFATVDSDLDNEFQPAQTAINQFILSAEQFRQASKDFYEAMSQLLPENGTTPPPPVSSSYGLSGENPVTYRWQDSRGDHSITVETSDFSMPKIKKKKSFFKVCLKLKHYDQEVKVRIIRTDPSGAAVGVGGLLGRWNPSGGTITRVSVAEYRGIKTSNDPLQDNGGFVKVVGRSW